MHLIVTLREKQNLAPIVIPDFSKNGLCNLLFYKDLQLLTQLYKMCITPKNVRYVTKCPTFDSRKLKKLKNYVCTYSYFTVWLIYSHFILCIVLNTGFTILQTTKRPLICGLLLFRKLYYSLQGINKLRATASRSPLFLMRSITAG